MRWDGLQVDYGKDREWLEKAQLHLGDRFASAITAGSGSYSNPCELRLFVSPGSPEEYRGAKSPLKEETPLLIQQAMIREDVWQALLDWPIDSWGREEPVTLGDYRAGVLEYYRRCSQLHPSDRFARRELEGTQDLYGTSLLSKYAGGDAHVPSLLSLSLTMRN